jgi:hypothetical protein
MVLFKDDDDTDVEQTTHHDSDDPSSADQGVATHVTPCSDVPRTPRSDEIENGSHLTSTDPEKGFDEDKKALPQGNNMVGTKKLHPEDQLLRAKARKIFLVLLVVSVIIIAVAVPLATKTNQNANESAIRASTSDESDSTNVPVDPLSIMPGTNILSNELMNFASEMVFISRVAYNETPADFFSGSTRYEDGIDAAILVKLDNKCIVAFQATTASILDWIQNIPFHESIEFLSATGKACRTQRGFHNAYFKVDYLDTLHQDIRDCISACPDGDCELILTGSSQGGAVAAVAAVAMDDLHPRLITFGQPATLFDVENGTSCSDIIPQERYIRFVNTAERPLNTLPGQHQSSANVTVLQYDPVVMLPARFNATDHLGNLILLGDGKSSHLALYPQGQREDVPPSLFANFDTHLMVAYIAKFQKILEQAGEDPVAVDGFLDSAMCNYDSECQSDSRCYNRTCTSSISIPMEASSNPPLDVGEPCSQDEDCTSHVCVVTCRDTNYRDICSGASSLFSITECVKLIASMDFVL